jgi:hypothetical protein
MMSLCFYFKTVNFDSTEALEDLPDDSAHDPGVATRADARRLRHRESDERLEWA